MSDLIRPEELFKKLQSDQPPVIIDVRSQEDYQAGHLPGAIHIPGDDVTARLFEIPKDRPVITY